MNRMYVKKHMDKNLLEPWIKTNINKKKNGLVNVTETYKENAIWIEM